MFDVFFLREFGGFDINARAVELNDADWCQIKISRADSATDIAGNNAGKNQRI